MRHPRDLGNEPAHPAKRYERIKRKEGDKEFTEAHEMTYPGMTKREMIATHVVAALIHRNPYIEDSAIVRKHVAEQAVAYADALLAELVKP